VTQSLKELTNAEKNFVETQRLDVLRRAEKLEADARKLYLAGADSEVDRERLRLNYEAKRANLQVAERAMWELNSAIGRFSKVIQAAAEGEATEARQGYEKKVLPDTVTALKKTLAMAVTPARQAACGSGAGGAGSSPECAAAERQAKKTTTRIAEVESAKKVASLKIVEEEKCRTYRNEMLRYRKKRRNFFRKPVAAKEPPNDKKWLLAVVECNLARSNSFTALLRNDLLEGFACQAEFAPTPEESCERRVARAKSALEEQKLAVSCEALEARQILVLDKLTAAVEAAKASEERDPKLLLAAGEQLRNMEDVAEKIAVNGCSAEEEAVALGKAQAALLCNPAGVQCLMGDEAGSA